ncbi:UDP-N-acetylglucosamine--N-acetylmuramyl-(pentapeptide) pyrophosphoryl-undecaprenol N-acetylglucosamine transferase [Austwickia sp. TVS 96-490-7B]|uniref:glycosyltransferase n=1 Tax=Austwickia sp. TVS 96-490-7B TaxID=2830843 RepID=UPI001C56F313|nr:glycosyltransferase [Austwickia sp. TVS 96-490-7B]MBW3085259.1 UDP-N-acetylglucosamine--N-acetylmuramyl-(pentapeptide) pyrophosphoryl-undecaprenol N-acetylglucosamine transferase [Austwickia sp. TVS 96-490-7B]
MGLRIMVCLGTDHHRFDRLVDWLDGWMESHPEGHQLTLQHGHSRPSPYADNHVIISREDVVAQMRQAHVVITQAGPGSIFDAHETGHRPVVVPRRRQWHEVVDDHQVAFADLMESRGDCVVARDPEQLGDLLDQVVITPDLLRRPYRAPATAQCADEVHRRMEIAVAQGAGWLALRRLAHSLTGGRNDPAQLPTTVSSSAQ